MSRACVDSDLLSVYHQLRCENMSNQSRTFDNMIVETLHAISDRAVLWTATRPSHRPQTRESYRELRSIMNWLERQQLVGQGEDAQDFKYVVSMDFYRRYVSSAEGLSSILSYNYVIERATKKIIESECVLHSSHYVGEGSSDVAEDLVKAKPQTQGNLSREGRFYVSETVPLLTSMSTMMQSMVGKHNIGRITHVSTHDILSSSVTLRYRAGGRASLSYDLDMVGRHSCQGSAIVAARLGEKRMRGSVAREGDLIDALLLRYFRRDSRLPTLSIVDSKRQKKRNSPVFPLHEVGGRQCDKHFKLRLKESLTILRGESVTLRSVAASIETLSRLNDICDEDRILEQESMRKVFVLYHSNGEQVYEMILASDGVASKPIKEKVMPIALKANVTRGQTSNDSVFQDGSNEDEDEEEEFNSMVKNLWKLFNKRNSKGIGSSRGKRNCYGCGSKNHFVDDCPKAKMKKVLVGGVWSDSEVGDQMEKDTTFLMAIGSQKILSDLKKSQVQKGSKRNQETKPGSRYSRRTKPKVPILTRFQAISSNQVIEQVAVRSGMDSKVAELTMSSPNHSTFDIEDALSSINILNYTSVSSDYFPASSGSISFNSSETRFD
ncbi:putative ribonuclease H-like domain-containing protein [Tanacetum coccineum]